jgi:hypothetical protein
MPPRLEVGDRNIFREYCTVNRGTVTGNGVTRIGDDNMLLAYLMEDYINYIDQLSQQRLDPDKNIATMAEEWLALEALRESVEG